MNNTQRRNSSFLGLVAVIVLLGGVGVAYFFYSDMSPMGSSGMRDKDISSFEECVAAGNPVLESYPRQCYTGSGKHFVENIGNELEKRDLIRLDSPRPNGVIASPLQIRGEARGMWYFEATFPVVLTDWDGRIIAEGFATAQDEWMTENFVPFTAMLEFTSPYKDGDPDFMKRGSLILQKSNPSGLPRHDDALEVPVRFAPLEVR